MNPTSLGTLMDNEFQHQVDEDLSGNSHEQATKGDIRNLALRVELRFTKLESTIEQRFMATDNRFTTFDASIKNYIYKLGWKFFAATIGTMGAMFTVFGMFVTSTLK
jgi:hypothetical protein